MTSQSPSDCSHLGAHKEVINGQRTGEYKCESCGDTFLDRESLEAAQEAYRNRQQNTQEQQESNELDEFQELLEAQPSDQAERLQELAHDRVNNLTDDSVVADLMARTNATGWFLDTLEVIQDSISASNESITCSAHAQFSGDQDEDSGALGNSISGTLSITLLPDLTIRLEELDFDVDEDFGDEY